MNKKYMRPRQVAILLGLAETRSVWKVCKDAGIDRVVGHGYPTDEIIDLKKSRDVDPPRPGRQPTGITARPAKSGPGQSRPGPASSIPEAALARYQKGERVSDLARRYKVSRQRMYVWLASRIGPVFSEADPK